MTDTSEKLLANNREWAARLELDNPGIFRRLAAQQRPRFLWIGCSDSRVPANEIVGLPPGSVFVHRNVANVVLHTDLNCLSAVEFAVRVLEVNDVIVCGHYGCGGVQAAMSPAPERTVLVDLWVRGIRDTYERFAKRLGELDEATAFRQLCEINVVQQVRSLCHTSIVRESWQEGRALRVRGWIYGIEDGLLRDLDITVDGTDALDRLDRTWAEDVVDVRR